ncbi:MAG TPA: SdrD B-like domain-containing protein [Humisphaera sp.]|nr:SdrD B-like domain-containing protein [Humisphaera sp.]
MHISKIEALESRRLLSGSIAGVVFNDLNGNGLKDTGEGGIGSTKVFIDLNNNGTPDVGEPNTLSNSLGSYVFTGLAPGNYAVGAVTPAGFKLTSKPTGGFVPLSATHDYSLKGSFADAKGGPALKTGGGTLSATGYTFANGQGPSLSSALTAISSYSIQVVFTPSTIGGYQKILDFKNRTSDIGLYSLGGQLVFYSGLGFGPVNTFKAGQSADVVLTRDASSKLVVAYVNGVKQFSFTDTGGAATFTGPNAIINILHDDGPSENFAGTLTHVSVFNSALSAAQVTALHKGGTQSHAGEWLVTLAANQVATGRNFGFQKLQPTQIKGIVFNDTNSDGVRQTTEAAIANATVFVDTNNNGKLDLGEQTTKTAADGSYSFVGLAAGTYHIGVVPQTGFRITTPNTGSPVITHDYELKGNLKDSLGGTALTSGGGTISASGYSFAADKGIELTSGINANSYSIEMRVKIATIAGYEKLIDFKNLGSDTGLYDLNGHLNFYNFSTGTATPIVANTFFDLVLTRNSSTKVVTGYVNGIQQFTFVDTSAAGTFTGPAWFLHDDTHTNHEASAGTLTRLRIYNGPLTAAQVLALHNGGTPPQPGHDFTITLAGGQTVANENFGEVKIA